MAGPLDDLKQHLRAFLPACEEAELRLKIRDQARSLIADGERVAQLVLREDELKQAVADLEQIFRTRREAGLAAVDADIKTAQKPVEAAKAEAEQIVNRVRRETLDAISAREADRKKVEESLERAQKELGRVTQALADTRDEAKRVAVEEEQAAERRRATLRADIGTLETKLIALKREDAEIQQRLQSLVRKG